jgi:6-hydroxycyclohex-1-ene-1-carbonyl-CoA dehydrogenase
VQVGYTRDKIEVRLSNLMAFDATVHGTWGCPPERYPEILRLIYDGKVVLGPFVERAPMSEVNRLLDDMTNHRLTRRMILDPRT